MPYKEGYGMKKAKSMDVKKSKAWDTTKNLKGNPKPKPMYKTKGGK